ncbi:hypothetical protein L3Q82_000295 [Scortum barcoo]|uniref:Uncharacterized protein n=1 Tax=Scortum barcoo TaxID=214431 RepID=A0ACB8X9T3_9TELE|nr:hypothetical protein L3Q82_000295 [Scortum barcoo]
MEELKYRGKKREGRHRDTWDPFQLNPAGSEKESKRRCFQLAQYLVAVIVGLAVLTTAVLAKGTLLVLSTLSSQSSLRSPKEKQFYMLMLVFCLVCPNVLVFIKSLWRCAFKSFVQPNMKTMLFICTIECLVSLGTSILVLVVMPQFDVLTNLFISGGVCIVSAILQIIFRLQRETWKIVFPICSLLLTVAGYCLVGIDYYVRVSSYVDRQSPDCFIYIAVGIFASLLVSLCWWENPLQATNRMQDKLSELDGFRDFVFVITSILRIMVIGGVYLIYHVLIEKTIVWSNFNLGGKEEELLQIGLGLFFLQVQRIERTSQLFVRRLYESAFIDLSLLLNTKMKVPRAQNLESQDDIQNCVIYLCATMWHETYDEMLKILTSMFRLDRYRGDPKQEHKDCFDFECHIFVDDAFMTETTEKTEKRLVNSYVNDLIHVVIEVYRVFTNKEPDDVSIIETPYGGRLMFVLPENNMLYIHLKDKQLIRNKKRWSQIMYLYYLLGWKGYITKNPQKITRQNNPCRASLISLDGESFVLPQYDNDNKRRFISDDNTYLLALDGDTDFQPKAVILLVDRLRMYYNVGAACGRIHPTGMGPMVWYQKFEYAVGHWLQKTAEHVFGSVLCSPGCFSLFRGSALMDDNVLKRYTTTATRASEYVQYDQGEDRWLCTLLLQQGWRVEYNAASDAYTNSPEEFKEFYNQRRRWGPSTLANTLDLLHSGSETVKRNMSISRLYILYQMFTVGSSILGPASVTLMIAGAFQFVFKMDGSLSIIVASIPPVLYIIICFIAKPNNQITIAAIMSILYAFLMTASLFSIIGGGEAASKKNHNVLCDKNCRLCCWDMKIQVTQETENLLIQKISGQTQTKQEQPAPQPPITNQEITQLAAATMVPQAKNDTTKGEAVAQAKKPTIDKSDGKAEKGTEDDSASSDDESVDKKRTSVSSSDEDEEDDDDFKIVDQERSISDWVHPVKIEFLKKLTYANMKRNLQEQIRYTLRNKNEDDVCEELVLMLTDTLNGELSDVGPEDILDDTRLDELRLALADQARHILKTSRMERLEKRVRRAIEKTLTAPQVEKLDEGEYDFWNKLLDRYLKPINDTQAHKDEVTKELKSLRNKAVFLYFIINVLWVVATFFLQAIGNDIISIKIPKYYSNGTESGEYLKVEPLSLMFLLSFAVLLLVQFLAMLYHRIYTLIHVVSYRSTEKDYKQKDDEDDDDGLTLENHIANGLVITSDDL